MMTDGGTLSAAQREHLVAVARTWVGTPWHHQQMAKGLGADCLGFLAGVALEAGVADARPFVREPQFRAYGREPDPAMLDEVCGRYFERLELEQATLGDVLRLRPVKGIYAQHFALVSRVAGPGGRPRYILHATNAYPRKVCEQSLGPEWWARVSRAYRFRALVHTSAPEGQ